MRMRRVRPLVAPAVALVALGLLVPFQTMAVEYNDGRREQSGPYPVRGWEPERTLLGGDTEPEAFPPRRGVGSCTGHRRTHYLFGLFTTSEPVYRAAWYCVGPPG